MKKIHGGRGGELTPFEPGERRVGRPAGVPNKTTRILKEAGILAAEIAGFPKFKRNKHGDIISGSVQATGKDGLVGYLTFVALTEPRAYLNFLSHLLPFRIDAQFEVDHLGCCCHVSRRSERALPQLSQALLWLSSHLVS